MRAYGSRNGNTLSELSRRVRPAKSTDHRTERSTYNQSSLALKHIFWDDIPNYHVQKKPETGCTKT